MEKTLAVYIAARYARREEMQGYRQQLLDAGYACTSTWVVEGEEKIGAADAAKLDLDDVERAGALIFFGEPRGSENRGGGRWFEFGYAFHRGVPCIAVLDMTPGPKHDCNGNGHESVFTAHPDVVCVTSFDEALAYLKTL